MNTFRHDSCVHRRLANNHDSYLHAVIQSPANAVSELRAALSKTPAAQLNWGKLKFGLLPEGVANAVLAGTAHQLQGWVADVLTAERLDRIF